MISIDIFYISFDPVGLKSLGLRMIVTVIIDNIQTLMQFLQFFQQRIILYLLKLIQKTGNPIIFNLQILRQQNVKIYNEKVFKSVVPTKQEQNLNEI